MTRPAFRFTMLLSITALLLASAAQATPGSTWLELGPGARSAALGEAVTASARGGAANYWNPAAVGLRGNSLEAMLADSWVEGGTIQYAAGAFDLGRYGIGFSAHYVGVGDIDLRDSPSAAPIGSYDVRNLALGGVIAGETWFGIRAGVGVKYLSEQIYVYDGRGWAVDLGLLREDVADGLDVGIAVRHLGRMSELREESEELPVTVAAGFRYQFDPMMRDLRPSLLFDVRKVSGYKPAVNAGVEVEMLGYLVLRGGYAEGYAGRGLTAGFGVMVKGIRFDFAYVPYANDLGNELRYSLGADW